MNGDLFAYLNEWMPKISKGHKKIAQYILAHYDKAAFMTAAKLGETVGISESTVVRFASELGFDGYPGLQKALQEAMRNKLTAVQRIEVSSLDQLGDGEVFKRVLLHDIEHIRHTLEETAMDQFNSAVDHIVKAKHVYVMGVRSSSALASFMAYYFKLMLPEVTLVQTGSRSELYEQILRIGEDDVMIAISFPRYSARLINAVAYAKEQGADIVAVTDSVLSPIAPYANQTLACRSDMASIVDSFVAPLSILNALVVAIAKEMQDDLNDVFDKLERIWDEFNAYAKVHE